MMLEAGKDLRFGITMVCTVWVGLFLWNVVVNVYRDHTSLVAANIELNKKLREATDNATPNLRGFLNVMSLRFPGESMSHVLVVNGTITNLGAPTVLMNWHLDIKSSDGKVVRGTILAPPLHPVSISKRGRKDEFLLPPNEYWPLVTRDNPITQGGGRGGWLYASFPDVTLNLLEQNHAVIILTLSDVRGKPWSFQLEITDQNRLDLQGVNDLH